jgi:S-adenosylmethionine decarboxylase
MPKKKGPTAYGLHLMLDGYDGDPQKLADVNLLYQTLNDLPAKIDMNKVGFPHIIQFTKPPIAGISGFVFIVESHISVHTYASQRFLSMDLYSCKVFDPRKVIRLIRDVYSLKRMETQLVKRGNYFNA